MAFIVIFSLFKFVSSVSLLQMFQVRQFVMLVSQVLEGVLSAALFPSVAQLSCGVLDLYESNANYGSSDFII